MMILVDGEAEDKLTNQYQLKLGLNYPIGHFQVPLQHQQVPSISMGIKYKRSKSAAV